MHKIVKNYPPLCNFPIWLLFSPTNPPPFIGKMTYTAGILNIHTVKPRKKSSPSSHHTPHWPTQTPHTGLQTPQF